jgi:hypothetical protein
MERSEELKIIDIMKRARSESEPAIQKRQATLGNFFKKSDGEPLDVPKFAPAEPQFPCPFCTQQFRNQGNLENHMFRKHEEYRFQRSEFIAVERFIRLNDIFEPLSFEVDVPIPDAAPERTENILPDLEVKEKRLRRSYSIKQK